MSVPPKEPKVYHITHIDNLASIISDGGLWSDAVRLRKAFKHTNVGMGHIKERRLRTEVTCHPGTVVGDYVPFYFCPRSVMLFLLYRGNHPDLRYRGGQAPILHPEFDLHAVVRGAERRGVRWAFTRDSAATEYITEFYNDPVDLDKLNWAAIRTNDWRDSIIREKKQAEFLVHRSVPWRYVERIGAINSQKAAQVRALLEGADHVPEVGIVPSWYY